MPRIACWILAVGRSAHAANERAISGSVRQSVRMKVAPRPLNLDPPPKTSPVHQRMSRLEGRDPTGGW